MSLISYAQLNREMKFKLIAFVDLISALISGIIGIYLALHNYGVWSIVIQQLVNSIILFFSFFFIKKWIPTLYFKFSSISSLFKFGKFIFLSNLLETVYSRFDILIIAKIFNVNTLGLYTRAQGLELTIRNLSSSSLLNVLFPAFSKIKENLVLLRESYYKYFEIICLLFFFIAGILGSVGHYCWTRAFHAADISSTQSLRFLDLVWTSALGWLIFSDIPSQSTWIGAVVILAATVWLARREGQRPVKAPTDEPVH